MGAPKNFYNAVDLNKFGIEDIDKRVLPKVSAANNGKIAKVIDGKWALGDDTSLPSTTGWDYGTVLFADGRGGWTISNIQKITAKLNGTVLPTQYLQAGDTEVTFTNDSISSDSMIEVYTDKLGFDPINISQTGTHTVKVTFDADTERRAVRLVVIG